MVMRLVPLAGGRLEYRIGVPDLPVCDQSLERSVQSLRHPPGANVGPRRRIHVGDVRHGVLGDATDHDTRDVVWPGLLVPELTLPFG